MLRMAKGSIPVFAAILTGQIKLLEDSIAAGLSLQEVWGEGLHIMGNGPEYAGYDPVMLASAFGHGQMISMLCKAGAEVKEGRGVDMNARFSVRVGGPPVSGTVLHWAVRIGDVGIIERLVGDQPAGALAGMAADITVPDHNGELAIDVARRTSPRRTGYNWMHNICWSEDTRDFAGSDPLGDLASHHIPLLEKV
ncbi:ankyrin repeat domain protein [Colletotrichum sp. SAR11_240]|nr:ankyrin repeat domain protein [Colletotrichum sp. SAR11_240]